MRNLTYIFMSTVLVAMSCQKDELINNFPAKISFDITHHLLEGKRINCIETTDDGKAWIGSGKELYFIDGSDQKVYTLDFNISDVSVAPDQTLWIGSDKGGLGHLADGKVKWYNTINAGLPRDYVRHVEVAPDGKIWFTSCAAQLGGLGIYDGDSFEFLTPGNSPLNYNIIDDIHIDPEGRVYFATSGTVGKSNIYRISKGKWECLGNEDGTFYWIFSFALGLDETIYLVEDFSLSSAFIDNKLHMFENNKWQEIERDDELKIGYFSSIGADKRNYCWMPGNDYDAAVLHVFNGETWVSSPKGHFPDDFFTCIRADRNNNIWAGTYYNGVFILNQ